MLKISQHSKLRRFSRTAAISLLGLIVLAAVLGGAYSFWLYHRPLPDDINETLFQGVTYIRDVRHQPRPLVLHVVKIDLDDPNIHFLVTPGESFAGGEEHVRTTSQFLKDHHVQLAINGSFFTPWWFNSIFDYYPHDGDPVDITGFASSEAHVYSRSEADHSTLYISRDNRVSFDQPNGDIYNALTGNVIFLRHGEIQTDTISASYQSDLHPRTAVALTRDGRTLLWFVIDGRQPNYSEGVSIYELAQIVSEFGGDTALNLDGGGSSTLVMEDQSGQPLILNSPIDALIPGRERPVANQLGVFAARIKP